MEPKAEITCHEEQASAILCETQQLPSFFFFFSLLVFVRGIALEHRGRREMESDILIRGSTVSRCGPAPCPRPICSLGPLEANHSPVSRAPQPNGLDAVCAALLIIQFVAKQLPI